LVRQKNCPSPKLTSIKALRGQAGFLPHRHITA
jgi:hypothetical protein